MAETSEGNLCWQKLIALFANDLNRKVNAQGLYRHNLDFPSALMSQLVELMARARGSNSLDVSSFSWGEEKKGLFIRIGKSQFNWEIVKGIQSLWDL